MGRRRKVAVAEEQSVENNENRAPKSKQPKTKEKPAKKFKNEPEWLSGDGSVVVKLILSIQKSDCNNMKVIAELSKLYNKMGHEAFMTVFLKMILLFLIRDENDEYAPQAMKFFGIFVASFGEDLDQDGGTHAIVQHTFKYILSITSKQYYIRSRVCLLVTNIMSSFSTRAEIDEAIMDLIIERMLSTFLKDVSPIVRQHAIMAMQRLQDPDNVEDQVTRAYIYHMETDPVGKVRQAAITAIAKKLPIISSILDRLQDNDEKVRRHTYLQMSSFAVKSYKIADRIKFLDSGLYDRSDMVKKAVNNILLPNWIAAYDHDYTEFIKAIKLDSSDKDLLKFRSLAQDALNAVFKARKISELIAFLNLPKESEYPNCLPIDKTSSLEWLIVWKVIIQFHQEHVEGKQKSGFDEQNDEQQLSDEDSEALTNVEILPELSVFVDFMEKFAQEYKFSTGNEAKYQKLNFNHCIIVLLEIAQLNDLGDEIGRNKLQALLKKILTEHELSEHVIKEIAHVMELLVSDVEKRIAFFNEVVNDMLQLGTPCEYSRQSIIEDLVSKADVDTKLKATSLKMELMELKEQESMFVERKQYADAQEVSEKYMATNEKLIELLRPLAEASSSQSQTLVENLSAVVVGKKITPSEILKNLRICYFAITTKGVKSLTQDVMKIYKEFVSYHLESSDITARIWALKTATAYSLLYETLAKDVYMILKGQVFKSNNVQVWEATINCVIDLLLRYSIAKMEKHDDNNQDLSVNTSQNRSKKSGRTLYTDDGEDAEDMDIVQSIDVIQMLTHVMEKQVDPKVTKATIIGFCKLILHGQYCTRDLVSKFMITYFNPATDPETNQVLGIFFESIVRMKKQESLHDALIPTLVTLLEAPYDSPLREVKQESVIKYVVGATRPVFCSNGLNLHNTLGLKMIMLMKSNPDNKEIFKVFSKELLVLEIGDDTQLKKDMLTHLEALNDVAIDARSRKNLTDFQAMLKGTYRPALKFSSTATHSTMAEDENEGAEEEGEEEETSETAASLFHSSDILEQSVTNIKMIDVVVNVTMLNNTEVRAENESSLVESPSVPSSSRHDKSPHVVKDPATEELEISEESDDEMNETVRERTVSQVTEDKSIPETPQTPASSRSMRSQSKKRHLNISRTLNGSLNSPLPKNPRQTATPKTVDSSRKNPARNEAPMTPITPTTSRLKLQATTPKTIGTARKTPARKEVVSSPGTPKTPRLEALPQSTPHSDRLTRQKEKDLIAQSSTLTRSASKKMNVDPSEVAIKTKQAARSNENVSKPAVKKTMIPKSAPVAAKQTQATKKSNVPVPAKAPTAAPSRPATARSAKTDSTADPKSNARKAANIAKAKFVKDIKQRPRWQ